MIVDSELFSKKHPIRTKCRAAYRARKKVLPSTMHRKWSFTSSSSLISSIWMHRCRAHHRSPLLAMASRAIEISKAIHCSRQQHTTIQTVSKYRLMQKRLTWRAITQHRIVIPITVLSRPPNPWSKHLCCLEHSSWAISQQSTKFSKEKKCKCRQKTGKCSRFTNLRLRCSIRMITCKCPKSY